MEELEELRLSRLRLGRNQQPSQGSRVSWGLCISEPQPSPGTAFHGERVCASGFAEYLLYAVGIQASILHTWNSGSQRQSNLPEVSRAGR